MGGVDKNKKASEKAEVDLSHLADELSIRTRLL
jgi:hypothetical protein